MPVRIGIGEQDDLVHNACRQDSSSVPIPQPIDGHHVLDFLVLKNFLERRAFGIQHLSAQWQNRLKIAVTTLFGAAAGRVTFDDEQF